MKTSDFQGVNGRRVGYVMRQGSPGGPVTLEPLKFRDFIAPYLDSASEYSGIYRSLQRHLRQVHARQATVLNGQRSVMMDVLASSSLDREATMASMGIIEKTYLKK